MTIKTSIMAKDPVCGMAVDPKKAEKKGLISKNGKKVYFCSERCKREYKKSWLEKHKYEVGLSVLAIALAAASYMLGWMLPFMGTVFIILSLLKLIDLNGFARIFSQYDLIAKGVKGYAHLYPFIELALGLAFIFQLYVRVAATITVVVMTIGAFGVANNLLQGKRCACLGAKIKVPLTTFTLVEDILMIAMSLMVLL